MTYTDTQIYDKGYAHGRDGIKFYPPSVWPIRSIGGRFDDIYKRGYEAGQRESWNPRIRATAQTAPKGKA